MFAVLRILFEAELTAPHRRLLYTIYIFCMIETEGNESELRSEGKNDIKILSVHSFAESYNKF